MVLVFGQEVVRRGQLFSQAGLNIKIVASAHASGMIFDPREYSDSGLENTLKGQHLVELTRRQRPLLPRTDRSAGGGGQRRIRGSVEKFLGESLAYGVTERPLDLVRRLHGLGIGSLTFRDRFIPLP